MIKATYEDLEFELQLRRREQLVWTTKDGRQIPIYELSTDHIINILNMMDKQSEIDELEGEMDLLDYYY